LNCTICGMHLNCLSQYEAFSANWGNLKQKLQIGNWVLGKGRFVFPCILSEAWVPSKWQSVTTADWHLPDLHLEKQIEKKAGQNPLGERFPVGSSARRHKRNWLTEMYEFAFKLYFEFRTNIYLIYRYNLKLFF